MRANTLKKKFQISQIIKRSPIWYYFLKLIIDPLFNFFWTYVINAKGKKLYWQFKQKLNNPNIKINNLNPCLIVRQDTEFYKIAKKISNELTEEFVNNEVQNHFDNNDLERNKNYYVNILHKLSKQLQNEIINFSKSEKNLLIASNYLKVLPVLGKINLLINFPRDIEDKRASMHWHKDDFGFKSLDFFIPIVDLDLENGPLSFIDDDNKLAFYEKVPENIKNAQPRDRNKIKNNDFLNYFPKEKIKTFTGKVGDGLLIDSFRVYHRGGSCNKNIRIMLRISYQTPDSSRISKTIVNEKNIYNKNIIKAEITDKIEKYFFFGAEIYKKKPFLINFLLFFYRIIHVKKKINSL